MADIGKPEEAPQIEILPVRTPVPEREPVPAVPDADDGLREIRRD